MKIKIGSTRIVFVFENIVVKIPIPFSWRRFIAGVASNYKEYEIWQTQKQNEFGDAHLFCPVEDNFIGLVLIMSRAQLISQEEFDFIKPRLLQQFTLASSQEIIRTNIGKIEENGVNRYVLIDYGINLRRSKDPLFYRYLRIFRQELGLE